MMYWGEVVLILVYIFYICLLYYLFFFSFFFQAEDGIRDGRVTGVQTCALPIYAVKQQREQDAGNRRRLLRKEIDRRGREQRQRDQSEANREFRAGESDVERHPPRSWKLRSFVTEHQHRQRFEGEAPHDAERVRLAENVHVPATDQNREHLQQHDQID